MNEAQTISDIENLTIFTVNNYQKHFEIKVNCNCKPVLQRLSELTLVAHEEHILR